jgi:hypothetical protein
MVVVTCWCRSSGQRCLQSGFLGADGDAHRLLWKRVDVHDPVCGVLWSGALGKKKFTQGVAERIVDSILPSLDGVGVHDGGWGGKQR